MLETALLFPFGDKDLVTELLLLQNSLIPDRGRASDISWYCQYAGCTNQDEKNIFYTTFLVYNNAIKQLT